MEGQGRGRTPVDLDLSHTHTTRVIDYNHHSSCSSLSPDSSTMLSSQVSTASRRALVRSSSPMIVGALSKRTFVATATSTPSRALSTTKTAGFARRSAAPFAAQQFRSFHATSPFFAETVKVPQMAESISEGTLKQWNKKKGDFVNADEEVAVIETDKVRGRESPPHIGESVVLTFSAWHP